MFAETIFAIVSDVNEEKIETWKEAHSMMNDAMKRIMAKELKESKDEGLAEGRSEGLAEGRSEGQDLLTEAMLTAQKENISDPAKLEELGYDKNTSICTIRSLGLSHKNFSISGADEHSLCLTPRVSALGGFVSSLISLVISHSC